MTDAAVSIDHAVKIYGAARVIDDVSLDVPQSAFMVLIGPSGCGKSTLLKMINGLVPLSGGSIRVNGQVLDQLKPEPLRRGIGYAIQSIGLFPHWSIARNIAAVPSLLGWDKSRIDRRVIDLLDLMRLPRQLGQVYPHQLSGGQQQRVGVARALAADPPLLLMDEPFGALDPISRNAIQDELKLIHRETGKTIIFVTHDLDEALKMATHLALLRDGRIVKAGAPVEVLEATTDPFITDFMGEQAGWRQLALHRVRDRMKSVEAANVPGSVGIEDSLQQALSQMIFSRADRLTVMDGAGNPAGTITLADLVGR